MGLAIGLARLIEVELETARSPELNVTAVERAPEAPSAPAASPAPSGASAPAEAAPARPEEAEWPDGRRYTVRKGDTLGAISKRVYGTTRHWRLILQGNQDVIPDPKKMRPGMTLRLPAAPVGQDG